jgi:hypothetical protein
MTMVERAAKAALERRLKLMGVDWTWESRHPLDQKEWIEIIRAAIEAMREPTEAMEKVAYEQFDWGPTGYSDAPQGGCYPRGCWSVMIDAALAEGTPQPLGDAGEKQ